VKRFALLVAVLGVVALGWGYWHTLTHATVNVALHDVALKTDRQAYGQIKNAEIVLLDADGAALAQGRASEPYGTVWFKHPQVGDCSRFESQATVADAAPQAWTDCFEAQSTWFAQWMHQTRYASLKFGPCRIEKIPVQIYSSAGDWWLWWVPLPHIGGKPYTYYGLTLTVDGAHCSAAGPGTNPVPQRRSAPK